jgi:BolA protein
MSRVERIEHSLSDEITFEHLEVLDESSGHSVPAGSESHFKVVAVSAEFDSVSRIARHRRINGLLEAEFSGGMHALAVHAYTLEEWRDRFGEAPLSPPCAGGTKQPT